MAVRYLSDAEASSCPTHSVSCSETKLPTHAFQPCQQQHPPYHSHSFPTKQSLTTVENGNKTLIEILMLGPSMILKSWDLQQGDNAQAISVRATVDIPALQVCVNFTCYWNGELQFYALASSCPPCSCFCGSPCRRATTIPCFNKCMRARKFERRILQSACLTSFITPSLFCTQDCEQGVKYANELVAGLNSGWLAPVYEPEQLNGRLTYDRKSLPSWESVWKFLLTCRSVAAYMHITCS